MKPKKKKINLQSIKLSIKNVYSYQLVRSELKLQYIQIYMYIYSNKCRIMTTDK